MIYPRGTGDEPPFDPLELSRLTEGIVTDGNKRKYSSFRVEPFYRQMSTARAVGCNLRCCFCWISPSRDRPEDYGEFLSPEEAYERILERSTSGYGCLMSDGLRISGCEPTIGKEHLLRLIDAALKAGRFHYFLLETNGILLGHDEDYVRDLKAFGDGIIVRPSIKAGTPEAFQKKTGAKPEFFESPFIAIERLEKHGIPYKVASMSKDPALMPQAERKSLMRRLARISPRSPFTLEEEQCDPFGITSRRLEAAGYDPSIMRKLQYEPVGLHAARFAAADRQARKRMGLYAPPEGSDPTLTEIGESLGIPPFLETATPCASCDRKNPWHGHGIEHDLDPKLK
jgi:uncharacterized Fe-S cluster-containing radical SAM superfamily protein